MPTALTIAGSDPSGGAGIQGDLKTFTVHGVHGTAVLTALTAQSPAGVTGVHDVPAAFVAAQLDTLLAAVPVAAAKTGMVSAVATIEAIAAALARRPVPHLVVDPVMVATSGDPLIATDAVAALVERLFPLATLVTPNADEAARLVGRPLATVADLAAAAREIAASGARAVLVKGGHLARAADGEVVDVLWADGELRELRSPRIETAGEVHGTGCALAAALAANLALGRSLGEAVERARAWVATGIARAARVGRGSVVFGHHPLE